MTLYLGDELLDQTEHNRIGPRPVGYNRSFELVDNQTGARDVIDRAGLPIVARDFNWFANGRPAINQLKAFMLARRGRAIRFWVPSFRRDMILTTGILNGASNFIIQFIGYTRNLFPLGGVRRHVRIESPGLTTLYRRISAASDPANGTENITVDTAFPTAYPAGSLISFLLLCRLTDDQVEWTWHERNHVECPFSITELPREAPT